MKVDIKSECQIYIKQPSCCAEKELDDFCEKVKIGAKVPSKHLKSRVRNCELIAFCYFKESLVGISSIKKPTLSYVAKIIRNAKINRKVGELPFEIGYSFTEVEFRKNGIGKELKTQLLGHMESRQGIIFSTTAVKSSQNFLVENGFIKVGEPFDGENDIGIVYFEKVYG